MKYKANKVTQCMVLVKPASQQMQLKTQKESQALQPAHQASSATIRLSFMLLHQNKDVSQLDPEPPAQKPDLSNLSLLLSTALMRCPWLPLSTAGEEAGQWWRVLAWLQTEFKSQPCSVLLATNWHKALSLNTSSSAERGQESTLQRFCGH